MVQRCAWQATLVGRSGWSQPGAPVSGTPGPPRQTQGEFGEALLSTSAVHIDTALTNVSVMYRNEDYVADQVLPEVPVDKQSDKYFVYGVENLRPDDDTRRPGSQSNEVTWSLSTDGYYADGHALSDVIPDEQRENQDLAL